MYQALFQMFTSVDLSSGTWTKVSMDNYPIERTPFHSIHKAYLWLGKQTTSCYSSFITPLHKKQGKI